MLETAGLGLWADGEFIGESPAIIDLVPNAIRLADVGIILTMGSDQVEWVSELQNNLLLYASPNLDEELTIQYEVANSDGRIESFTA